MLIQIALPLVLAFIMFSLGLGLKKSDFTRIFKFPKAFAVGLLNQVILLPLIALGLALVFRLSPEFSVGLIILALCPGGVTSNVLARIAGGNTPLSISLTAVTSLLSMVTVPILVALAVRYFMGESAPSVDVTKLGFIMFLITAVPVSIGMLVTKQAPDFTHRFAPSISRAAIVLFIIIIAGALAKNWTGFITNLPILGPVTVLLNIALLALGLASARLLKLNKSDASTIAIESGIQNGTLAITVGALIAVSSTEVLPATTVPAAVYSITMYLVSVPFVLWRRKA